MTQFSKVKLDEVCTFEKGATGIKKAIPGEYPMVSLAEDRITHNEYQFDQPAVLIPLVSSTGHGHASINRLHFQEGQFALGSILVALTPKDVKVLHPYFLYIYLSYFKDQLLVPLMRGAANVSLSIKSIKEVEIYLPPYSKQIEIIQKESRLKQANNRLNNIYSTRIIKIEKLLDTLIQEAIQGKLTANWREINIDVVSACILLSNIKKEKEKLNQKIFKKNKSLPPIVSDKFFELPETWSWCYIQDVCDIRGGKRIPKGYRLSKNKDSHIYIRILDMKNGTINTGNLAYISDVVFEKIKNYTISHNDLYVTIAGTIGQVGIIPKEVDGANLTENSAKLCNISINKKFLLLAIQSLSTQNQFINKKKGVAQPKLALKRIANSVIPIPPKKEQDEIVKKMDLLLDKVSILKKNLYNDMENTDLFIKSALKEILIKK